MIKLQDFANQKGITDRQVQRQLKKYETELTGHFERKGRNGTWLDNVACSFLENKMLQSPVIQGGGDLLQKINELQAENESLQKQLIKQQEQLIHAKDVIIELTETKAQLEASEKSYHLLETQAQNLQTELNKFKPTIFGLYKKQG